ncbi:MAG: nickel pincer cofactor biosynthesis protein LarC [Thermodesulfovibrionales bacterium]|nr:nickel pincer cofactor biosynthesis protein LarC [Thermodesulfovibrionales bacterium]
MRVIYFDPILGASGDMILSSLIDLGVKVDYLRQSLKFIPDLKIKIESVSHQGIMAKRIVFITKKVVKEKDFIPLVEKSKLKDSIKNNAIKIINHIFDAERNVHGSQHLHLHELADVDTIIDITGALIALDFLNVNKVYSRPLKAGTGLIETVEGKMPAFNLATAQLLKNSPVEFLPVPFEFTTPTAAAILSTIAEFTDLLTIDKIEKIGIGAGSMKIEGYPNLLRTFLGEVNKNLTDECLVIETNIDDQNPQDFELILEKLYDAGALEVFYTPVIMKHSRPGILLSVITDSYNQKIIDTIFNETTTLGIRMDYKKRIKIEREIKRVRTPYGNIRIKVSNFNKSKRFTIEYQDLKSIAKKLDRPIRYLRIEIERYVRKEGLID